MNLLHHPPLSRCSLSLLLLTVLAACASTVTAPDTFENNYLISIYASTGGPGPRITSLEIGDAGSIVYGYLGESPSCSGVLKQRDLHQLREAIHDASDIFISLAVADYAASFSDTASVDFSLPEPPGPGLSSEIVVPEELFPISLVPLMSLLDRVAQRTRELSLGYHPNRQTYPNRQTSANLGERSLRRPASAAASALFMIFPPEKRPESHQSLKSPKNRRF